MKQKSVSDEQLVRLLCARMDAARTATANVRTENAKQWSQYRREAYGDETPGRAKYVSGDVCGTVDWTLTDLLRLFLSGGQVAGFEPSIPGEQAETYARQEQDYSNHIFLKDNPGFQRLRDYLLNGLVGLRGYLATYWEDPKPGDTVKVTGADLAKVEALLGDPAVTVDADSVVARTVVQDGQEVTAYDYEYTREDYSGCIRIEAPHPDNVIVSPGYDDEDEADYICLSREVTRSDLVGMFPDKKQVIADLKSTDDDDEGREDPEDPENDRRQASTTDLAGLDKAGELFMLHDEYVRIDMDNDGIAERWNVKRVGRTILSRDEVDIQPLSGWSSRPEPNRMFASSVAKSAEISQRFRTVMMRTAIDGARLSTIPRYIANQKYVDINSLMNMDYGAVIQLNANAPANTPLGNVVQTVATPDISGAALALAEKEEREREFVTGVNRQSQGLDPDSLTDTYRGQALLQNSAAARKEMIAREAANGLERVFEKIGKLLRRHHDFRRDFKTKTGWVQVEPSHWLGECAVDVDVGTGTGSREAAMGRMEVIADRQERLVTGGMTDIVTPDNIYNTLAAEIEAMGLKSPDRFYTKPKPVDPNAPPPPDPETEAMKADLALQEQKQQHEMALQEQKAQHETELAEFRAAKEAELAELRAAEEARLARIKAMTEPQVPALSGYRPGGRLDQ